MRALDVTVDRRELGAIFLGGAGGALARVGLTQLFPTADGDWPWAIFLINLSGAFLLGYAIGPAAGVLLWTHIGKGVWLVVAVVGVVITGPGIWSLRQPSPVAAETAAAGTVSSGAGAADTAAADKALAEAEAAADAEAVDEVAAEMPPPDVPLAATELPDEPEPNGVTGVAPTSVEPAS